jgi:hypothetical protein
MHAREQDDGSEQQHADGDLAKRGSHRLSAAAKAGDISSLNVPSSP